MTNQKELNMEINNKINDSIMQKNSKIIGFLPFLTVAIVFFFAISANAEDNNTGTVCPQIYAPVCGTNGITYSNSCYAEAEGIEIECNTACPCQQNCIEEGQSGAVIPGNSCCSGLDTLSPYQKDSSGNCQPLIGAFVCTKCGNGECGLGEDYCNCPSDCQKACTTDYVPVCGVDGKTYSNKCYAERAGAKIKCWGKCPCPVECSGIGQNCGGIAGIACCSGLTCQIKENYPDAMGTCVEKNRGFYISAVWTDKEKYVLKEDKEIQIFAKIKDFDETPSTPEEGTTAMAKINGLVYVTKSENSVTSASTEVSALYETTLTFNSASGYYEGKTNLPGNTGTYIVDVSANNPNRNPNNVSNSTKFFVAQGSWQEIVYVQLNEKFSLLQNQQANVQENNETVMKIKFDSVIGLACMETKEAGQQAVQNTKENSASAAGNSNREGLTKAEATSAACGGNYGQFSVSTIEGYQQNISLREGSSTIIGSYKIYLGNLQHNSENSQWTASVLVERASETIVYANLDEAFWLEKEQTALIESTPVKLTLVEIYGTGCSSENVIDNTNGCKPGKTTAVLKSNLPPYKLSISEGETQTVGDYFVKFNYAKENLAANFTVSKQAEQPTKIVGLNEKFELLLEQTALVKETSMTIKLLGIAMPTEISPASAGSAGGAGGISSTGNIVASTASTTTAAATDSITTAQSVSSSGKVEEIKAPIRVDSRPAARLLVSMPVVCEQQSNSGITTPCAATATEIWLRQGESRTIFGYRIHALQVDSSKVVLIVKKDIEENYVKAWLGQAFSLEQKQTAFVADASMFLKLNSIAYAKCLEPESPASEKCVGAQFAKITVWREKYGIEDEKASIEREIKILPGETIELYGYKINLAKLSPETAVFIVTQKENPGEINVHTNEPFKLSQNMSANVLEANIKIEVLELSDDTVKFSVSNYLYSKEYVGKKVSSTVIEKTITEKPVEVKETVKANTAAKEKENVMLLEETIAETSTTTESMPPMPFEVYSLQAGQSIEKNDYTITVLEVNSNAAVFVVKEKGLNKQIVIQINKGWNLFSLPGEMSMGTSDCDSGNFKIFEYNKALNKFEIVSSPKIGKAYWIYNAGKTCTAKGTIGKAATFEDLESIGQGWNFIGIIPEMIGKTVNETGNCSFSRAFMFNSAAQKWENALDKKISENNLGEAMAVFSEETCSWIVVSETPPMPPAP